MVFGIASLMRVSALRRFVALACALAFLAVSFAHLVHHVDFVSEAPAVELSVVSVDATGDAQDDTKKTSSVEHCHGCMLLAIVVAELPGLADTGVSVVDDQLLPPRSILRSAEYPPPRS